MISSIRHTGLLVSNLKDGIAFYKKLGFRLGIKGVVTSVEAMELYGTAIEVPYIKMYVVFGATPQFIELYEMPTMCGYQCNHIAFTTYDIKKAWGFFKRKGLVLSTKIVERDSHKLFFTLDPFFNVLEIVEPPK